MAFQAQGHNVTPFNGFLEKHLPFLPHERYLYETPEEVEAGFAIKCEVDAHNVDKIRGIRDESNRPWWNLFDEYEYRHTKKEKKLLLKLDLLITVTVFIGYWAKSLDQNNLNNVYVSGMKEDLDLKGNNLIKLQGIFLIVGVIFEVPMAHILPRFPPVYVLFTAQLFWSFFTLISFKAHNFASLSASRFFVGVFKAAFFRTAHHLFATWYKPTEVSSKAGFFYFGLYLRNLTAGLLQSAIHDNLDRVLGCL